MSQKAQGDVMNFIETLKSVGGVKPCPCGGVDKPTVMFGREIDARDLKRMCPECHGTGQILDLAPLLAKPKELFEPVQELISDWAMEGHNGLLAWDDWVRHTIEGKNLHVIGPRSASNLIYEVARQLGGTAVVAYIDPDDIRSACWDGDFDCNEVHHQLSLPIPADATVLFVTDTVDVQEMADVIAAVLADAVYFRANGGTVLPYLLALVSSRDEVVFPPSGSNFASSSLKVISLHQEKP